MALPFMTDIGMEMSRDWKLKLEKFSLEETCVFKIVKVFEYQNNLTLEIVKNILDASVEFFL